MAAKLRIGIVGLGTMGRHHLRVLHAMDEVEVVGVADPLGPGSGRRVDAHVVHALDELLDLGLDACVVASPTELHEEMGLQLAHAEVHTLIEKPLADTVAGGKRLVEAFARAGVVGCVGHIERYNAAMVSLHQRLADHELGSVYQVTTSRQGPFPDRIRDVGVVKDLGTHDLDLTAWAVGSPYKSISAEVTRRAGREHEDLLIAVGTLRDQTLTNHLVNWLSPVKERRVVVTGERGALCADMLTADLTFYTNGKVRAEWDELSHFRGVSEGDVVRYALSKPEPLWAELVQFCAAARGEVADIVSCEAALQALVVAEAALRSAREGRTVVVES